MPEKTTAREGEKLLFPDGSVAKYKDGRWVVYVGACYTEGQAGRFVKETNKEERPWVSSAH